MSAPNNSPLDQLSMGEASNLIAELSRDIHEHRTEAECLALQIETLVTTDAATGLLNLAGVVERIESSMDRLDRTGEPFGVMLVRIPQLALIAEQVDVSSYAAAVRDVGQQLSSRLRAIDQVGLVERRSYLISLPELTPDRVEAVVDRVSSALEAASTRPPTGDPMVLQPEIGVVVNHGRTTCDVPTLLDILWTIIEEARFRMPSVVLAPPSTNSSGGASSR